MSYEPKQDVIDRVLVPVQIEDGKNTLDVTETVSGADQTISITIPAGEYFCFHRFGPNHDSPQADADPTWQTGFEGLYREICNRLNALTVADTSGGGYQIEWVPPSDGDFPYPSTVRLFHTDPNVDGFSVTANTLPIEFLGAHPDDPSTSTFFSSSGDGSGRQEIRGRVTAWGFWTSPRVASFKRSFGLRDVKHAEVDFGRHTTAEWQEWVVRRLEYQRLPAIHAVDDRARRPQYADIGDLEWWDAYNAFENYWERMRDAAPCIILYGSTWGGQQRPDGTTVDWPNANADLEVCDGNVTTNHEVRSTVEVARMYDEGEMSDFREVVPSDENRSSEHYPLELTLRVDPDQRWGY
jgi:hypothetical protein